MAPLKKTKKIKLAHGLEFKDLYEREGLVKLDALFLQFLNSCDADLAGRLGIARDAPSSLDEETASVLMLSLAPYLEQFLFELFDIKQEARALKERHASFDILYKARRLFVQKIAVRRYKKEEASSFDGGHLARSLNELMDVAPLSHVAEFDYARSVMAWLQDEKKNEKQLDLAARYGAWASLTVRGKTCHEGDVVFHLPERLDPYGRVHLDEKDERGASFKSAPHLRNRKGFSLSDEGYDLRQALGEVSYCILCHHQGKDSCSKGFAAKKGEEGYFRKNVFGEDLNGCPLEEKISQMHEAKGLGLSLSALAIACIDNPMVAGTGHRICNDCMKGCIYQKQDPVDIPQVESRILKDVLGLPWGFEIYSLLTRWNPLNFARYLPLEASGYKVLVVGLGPAGYTLAHHLLNEGHGVVAIDGLKIEPLPDELSGRDVFEPVYDAFSLSEDLDERVSYGFGGVAEYGITSRWDKNFLLLLRLLIERRRHFALYGGVLFGGTLTFADAFAMGFDHIALCMGAGRPTYLSLSNGLARGVRQASDFLMALQLTGAARKDSVSNLQLRLPVVVIGGGLTAIDTATEAMTYYVRQCEKFLKRFEILVAHHGSEEKVRALWTEEETHIADEFLTHGRILREAKQKGESVIAHVRAWGGVTIAYRRRLVDSPAYRLNPEEVELAMEEGISFMEEVSPERIDIDRYGHASGITLKRGDGSVFTLAASSILVAAGTKPNVVLARENDALQMEGNYFRLLDEEGKTIKASSSVKGDAPQVMTSFLSDGRGVSFFGDLHPSYAGNVVKAMASAKQGYPIVSKVMARLQKNNVTFEDLRRLLDDGLNAYVRKVIRLAPRIVELELYAPFAARHFRPGQFYRLQNFETQAQQIKGTRLGMEGIALTGASVDKERGYLSTIVLEMGGSSDLCHYLKEGERVILMGPTGTPTDIPSKETVMLVGGGLGNAVLFSIGSSLRAQGSRVLYFAGYRKAEDRYKIDQIHEASDVVVWCCDHAPAFTPERPQDKTFVGNIIQAMCAYVEGEMGETAISLSEIDRIIAIGSDGMMAAVKQARKDILKDKLKKDHLAIGSINSPMQCMMKEICAQCLQRHIDPRTGEERIVFSCFNQDQPLDAVDFSSLSDRLTQNSVQEKLSSLWLAYALDKEPLAD